MTTKMSLKSLTKKYIAKPAAIALAAGMISSPLTIRDANAEGLKLNFQRTPHGDTRFGVGLEFSHDWLGGGKKSKSAKPLGERLVNSLVPKAQTLEQHAMGLGHSSHLNSNNPDNSNSTAYFKKYTGDWASFKEFLHGATTPTHLYNTTSNNGVYPGPFYLAHGYEGGALSPLWGIGATLINGGFKLFGSDTRVYNPLEKNPARTLGTAAIETIGLALLLGSSSSDNHSNTPQDTSTPLPPQGGGDI
ncbi:hypothetical protein K9L16_03225 [Candidatus Pacearchaeota archaeon]|nr:hypothetical protein [Candidatus Pacearchaeota archaeon]